MNICIKYLKIKLKIDKNKINIKYKNYKIKDTIAKLLNFI